MISVTLLLCGHGQVNNGLVFCRSGFSVVIVFSERFDSLIFIIIVRYYIEPAWIVICGQPSASLADKIENDEKVRIAAQLERLGSDGLKKAEAELEVAKSEHEKPVPTELITSFPVPDVKSIFWHSVQSVQEPGTDRKLVDEASGSSLLSKHIESDGKSLPFFVEYDHIEVCSNLFLFSVERILNFSAPFH